MAPSNRAGVVSSAPMLGRYRMGERLGEGGMGVVFLAFDPELDRRVAVKLLHAKGDVDRQRIRLMREAQAMAKLAHPNAVAIYDVGRVGDQLFVAMELVEGTTLSRWLAERPRARPEVLAMFAQAGRGLAAAHAVGLVHRDFKPENVLVGRDGRARVTDFGLARAREEREGPVPIVATTELRRSTFGLAGTPAYMAPEQFRGEPADPRTDQFSFCIALYEALFGVRPFEGESLPTLAGNVIAGRLRRPPSNTPGWLRRLLVRGLTVDRNARFPTMDAIVRELERDHGRGIRIALGSLGIATGTGAIVALLHAVSAREVIPSVPPSSSATNAPGTTPPRAVCAEYKRDVAAHWNDERKKAIVTAFDDTKRYWARSQSGKVAAHLDRLAKAWSETRDRACSGKLDDTVLLDALACLDERLADVDALVTELTHPDDATLVRAGPAADRLQSPKICVDPAVLARRPKLPSDPEARAKIALLHKELATVFARSELGKVALDDLDRIVNDAKATGDAAALADALFVTGHAAWIAGDETKAADLLARAVAAGESAKHPNAVFAAATDLVIVHGVLRIAPKDVERWRVVAEAERGRAGHDPRVEVAYLASLGWSQKEEGKLLLARTSLEQAIAVGQARLGSKHGDVIDARGDLAEVLRALEDWKPALETARAAVDDAEARFGIEHPRVAMCSKIEADVLIDQGDPKEAIGTHARALKIREDALLLVDVAIPISIDDVGRALELTGRLEEAEKKYDRARRIRENIFVPDHPEVARSKLRFASLHAAQGKHAEAIADARAAVAWIDRTRGKDDVTLLPEALLAFGDYALAGGDKRAALSAYERVAKILEARFGEDTPRIAIARWRIGLAKEALGDKKGASAALESAVSPMSAGIGWEHPRAWALAIDRARLELALGDRKRAEELFDVAVSGLEKTLGKNHPQTKAAREARENALAG